MSAREAVRRVLIWIAVAVYLALCILTIVATGLSWPLVAWGGFTTVGAVILNARRGNWVGRLLLALGLYWGVTSVLVIPWVVDRTPAWAELAIVALAYLLWVAVPLLVLVFPSGRVETRFGRALTRILVLLGVVLVAAVIVSPAPLDSSGRANPFAVDAVASISDFILNQALFGVVPLLIALALIDLVLRWRRSSGARRLQFRWLVYGTAVTVVIFCVVGLVPGMPAWLGLTLTAGLNAIPISIGIAVTRHGLYEIGRVVSRTVSYAIVTVLIVGVYAGIVVSTTRLLPGLPSVGVALATLAAAALFLPVLRWVQRRVDRRFDRERYDAAQVVDAFGEHLRADVNPDSTAGELVDAVEQTLQPAAVGLWVARDPR